MLQKTFTSFLNSLFSMRNLKFSKKTFSNFSKYAKDYSKNGFVIIRNFIDKKIIQDIKKELKYKKKIINFFIMKRLIM